MSAAAGGGETGAMNRHHSPDYSCKTGLTLIEMMMVLAVIAILVGLGVPSMGRLAAQHQLTAAVNSYVAGFQQARLRAVTLAGQTVACPSRDGRTCTGGLDWGSGWLIYDDDNRNRRLDPGENVVAVFQPLRPQLSAFSSIGRPSLVYRADGSSAGSNLRVTVCDQRGLVAGRSIVVNQGGRPRAAPDELGRCG